MVNNKAYRGHALRTVVVTMLVLLLAGSAGAQTNISSCTTISSPGEFVLNQSIMNSGASSCINIISSDVVFDGAGFTIDGVGTVVSLGVNVYNSTALTNVTVKNLTVTDWYYGIYYNNVSNGAVDSNNASNNTVGILLDFSSSNILNNNTALSNYDGIYLYSSSSYNFLRNNNVSYNYEGIYLVSSSNNTLNGNNASNNYYGINPVSSNNNNMSGNIAMNNNVGILLYFSSSNTLSINNASNNENGILLYSSSNNNILTGNTANSNNVNGFSLQFANNNNLAGNNALNNGQGISLSTSSNNNTLSSNNASNNGNGITLASSSNNTIYNNYFNNTNNAIDIGGGVNNWNITKQLGTNIIGGPYLGGNFWSNYAGVDINGDGLGDTLIPYNNSGSIINGGDYLPLIQVKTVSTGNVTGGGWIISPIKSAPKNNNKATFGFVARFVNGIPTGNLEYIDHVNGMNVQGNVTTLSVDKAAMNATFSGTATINGTGAYVYTVNVHDGGEPGRVDTFAINITAKPYAANGTLGGGNIQIHDP